MSNPYQCKRHQFASWLRPCPKCEIERKDAEIERLQKLTTAQQELIWAYEDELEPENFDEEDLPEAIAKARRAVEAAEEACNDPSGDESADSWKCDECGGVMLPDSGNVVMKCNKCGSILASG